MQQKLIAAFNSHFGIPPSIVTRAAGRVNLIGEHTDYQDGFVLPMAIDRSIWVAATPRDDNKIHALSLDFDESVEFSLDQLTDSTLPHWTHYIRGIWYLLGENGTRPSGANIALIGNVPLGAGLSSSAAVEIALIDTALVLLGVTSWSQSDKALFGVKVEHEFTKMPCGVMDQMASAMGIKDHALLIDCRSLEVTPVQLPTTAAIITMDTKTRHNLADSEYPKRRETSEYAAKILNVKTLRDATLELVNRNKSLLSDEQYRRAKHGVTENSRVLAFIEALENNDLTRAGQLMNESHYSLRDDYEVSCKELDIMTDIARQQSGCYGARMTGGGFGGCAVALVDKTNVDGFMQIVTETYYQQTGIKPDLYQFDPAAGSEVIR